MASGCDVGLLDGCDVGPELGKLAGYESFLCFAAELKKFAESLEQQRRSHGQQATLLDDKIFSYSAKVQFDEFKLAWGPFLGKDFYRKIREDDQASNDVAADRSRADDDFDSDSEEANEADGSPVRSAAAAKGRKGKSEGFGLGTAGNEDEEDDDDSKCGSDSDADSSVGRNRDDNFDRVEAHSAGSTELEKVFKEAHTWIKKLKHDNPEQIGVQILELFVRDCMGQHSRQSVIFSQKIRPVELKFVMPWSIKCFTFLGLCILNIYFVFACMLYGKDKGITWQRGWLFTCIVNIFVDVFINAVTVAAVMHYFVPNLIVDKARSIKQIVTNIVHDFCTVSSLNIRSIRNMEVSSPTVVSTPGCTFSATDYFFVSAHVARGFPDLLESKIVLAYKSLFLSKEQMDSINPNLAKRQQQIELGSPWSYRKHRRTRTNTTFLDRTARRYRLLKRTLASVSLWTTTLLLVFGSQSLLGQEFIINMFNPGLVAAITYLGLAIWKNSFFGMLVAVVLVVGGFSVIYWALHRLLKRRSTAQSWLSQSSAGGSQPTDGDGGVVPVSIVNLQPSLGHSVSASAYVKPVTVDGFDNDDAEQAHVAGIHSHSESGAAVSGLLRRLPPGRTASFDSNDHNSGARPDNSDYDDEDEDEDESIGYDDDDEEDEDEDPFLDVLRHNDRALTLRPSEIIIQHQRRTIEAAHDYDSDEESDDSMEAVIRLPPVVKADARSEHGNQDLDRSRSASEESVHFDPRKPLQLSSSAHHQDDDNKGDLGDSFFETDDDD
jgi:hypothetical protein